MKFLWVTEQAYVLFYNKLLEIFPKWLNHLNFHQVYESTSYSLLFSATFVGTYQEFHCDFICTFLMPNDREHFSCSYWSFIYLYLGKIQPHLLPIFNWVDYIVIIELCMCIHRNLGTDTYTKSLALLSQKFFFFFQSYKFTA